MFFSKLLLIVAAPLALADDFWCGSEHPQRYNPLMYTCIDGILCPYAAGIPMKLCGLSSCYSEYNYDCQNDTLVQLPKATGAVKLIAVNPAKMQQTPVEACGSNFFIKDGGPCAYCPDIVTKQGGQCPAGQETVVFSYGVMNTLVPGGQRYYVDPSTAMLAFTKPHSSEQPAGASSDVVAYEKGAFQFNNTYGWMGCPSYQAHAAQASYQIYAKLPAINFASDCIEVVILTVDWQGLGAAAWEYI